MISILDTQFSLLNLYLSEALPTKIFILCDENTNEYCLPTLLLNMQTDIPFEIIEIEAGEEMKTIETAKQLWEILADFGADRKSLLINLGGGVITDLGGFVASTYKRGIRFVNMPTSLLAMCDASIGGKTGIDHQFLKNVVGTFAHPEAVFVYPNFLDSLPFVELRSGFAEMLKHGLIASRSHWENLSSLSEINVAAVSPYIKESMMIKEKVVSIDFKEENIRKTLNFGHTIGHAIESLFLEQGSLVPHGEAVAAGMICETYLSCLEGLINRETCDNIINTIRKFYPVLNIQNFTDEALISLMTNDKKNASGKINFSLISAVGSGIYDYQSTEKNIIESIEFYGSLPKDSFY